MSDIKTLREQMMLKLPSTLELLKNEYISKNEKFYNPRTLGYLILNLYESGVQLTTKFADESRYYLYIDGNYVDLQNFTIDNDINKVITPKEQETLQYINHLTQVEPLFDGLKESQSVGFEILHNILDELDVQNDSFTKVRAIYDDTYFKYMEHFNKIYSANKPEYLNTISIISEAFNDKNLDFIENPQSFVELFTTDEITPIQIEFTDGPLLGIRNTFLKYNDIYFNPSSEWYNSNIDVETLFLRDILEVGADYKIVDILNSMNSISIDGEKKAYEFVVPTTNIPHYNVEQISKLEDFVNKVDITDTYMEIKRMFNSYMFEDMKNNDYPMNPEVIAIAIMDIYKQGIPLESVRSGLLYLYINDGLLDLQTGSFDKNLVNDRDFMDRLKISKNLSIETYPLTGLEEKLISEMKEQYKVVYPEYKILLEEYETTKKEIYNTFTYIEGNTLDISLSEAKDFYNKNKYTSTGGIFMSKYSKNVESSLKDLVDMDNSGELVGKLVKVGAKGNEFNAKSVDYLYERNNVVFTPVSVLNGENFSCSLKDMYMKRALESYYMFPTSNVLRDFKDVVNLNEQEIKIDNDKPFDVIEVVKSEPSLQELLERFQELNDEIKNVAMAIQNKIDIK